MRTLHGTAFFLAAHLAACGGAGPAGGAVPDAGADAAVDGGADADSDGDTDSAAVCGTASPAALAACVDGARYEADLVALAIERPPWSAGWEEVQAACASRLEELGFDVALEEYGSGVNVVGRLPGAIEPEVEVVVSAHYDHVPGCPGADDNASGVAGALEAARVLADAQFARTLVVACWDEEEEGKVGSEAFVAAAVAAGTAIEVAIVLEMIGYASDEPGSQSFPDGFELLFPDQIAEVAANDSKADFLGIIAGEDAHAAAVAVEHHTEMAGVSAISLELPVELLASDLLADLRRSDHDPFWQAGYPALMLTDTANYRYAAYHCMDGADVPENLSTAFATAVVRGAVAAAAEALGLD
jgi:Zn-dependent M28 family amino/carboxypeptidase